MIYQPVRRAINEARAKLDKARRESAEAEATPLNDAFETLRLAIGDLTDAVETLYGAAAVEEEGR